MSFCDLMLAFGISGALGCPQIDTVEPLPPMDKTVFEYKAPEPEKKPEPKISFPPVVIRQEKVIIKEVPAPVVTLSPPPEPEPEPEPQPDLVEIQAQEIYNLRHQNKELFAISNVNTEPVSMIPKALPQAPEMEVLGKYEAPKITSTPPVDNSYILTTDRYISGVLETGINSQLSGDANPIVIQVSRDVYGYHGRNALIPKGSRMVCSYTGPNKQGISRTAIACSRIFIAGTRAEIWGSKSYVTDQQAHVGISGDVDNRFGERYNTAFGLAFISAAVRAAAQTAEDTEADSSTNAIVTTGAEELSQRFGEITSQILEANINLKPILTVPQGTRVQIRPAEDWYIAHN